MRIIQRIGLENCKVKSERPKFLRQISKIWFLKMPMKMSVFQWKEENQEFSDI